ncbi:lipase family protein [Aspergillus saccharolyticus JOP 1030-1]|uniref:feruloyl esterase n=1 Tax=Aspergillus saccharolyticus JOP 1030-1 TaxID=1450539 RepID=A0A318ZJU8_9EURO|nr:putative extracellular triacylglycerol lipase [Aspergillus saccharolyticus JOP 1030-1]PYH40538.1 putative extracellular triacylglycerol lipase [Aspergillus saccharolyticus JOP 1030-1]
MTPTRQKLSYLLFFLASISLVLLIHTVSLVRIGEISLDAAQQAIPYSLFRELDQLARVVDVSYCVGNTGLRRPFECLSHCADLKGFELISVWNTGPFLSDSCGYIALSHPPSPKRIIVAFRGTYSIANTIIDLSAYPQSYVPYDPGNSTGDDTGMLHCDNCTVHAGFMTSWHNTRAIVLNHVSTARLQFPDYDLVLVGHSLGGAVAALAGVEMQLRGWKPTVTTFGEPKVGNQGFAEYLAKLFELPSEATAIPIERYRFHRVTHINDPVPLLPLAEWGYEMHAGEIFIAKAELPPSVSDVKLCEGNADQRCISGGNGNLKIALDKTASLSIHSQSVMAPTVSKKEQVLARISPFKKPCLVSQDNEQLLDGTWSKFHWHLIPSRLRLWELFFSHRDYFWRLGLCIPGGDPSGKG